MKKKSIIAALVISSFMAMTVPACKPTVKDEEIVNKIESSRAGMSGLSNVNVTVKNGNVTLTGSVTSEQAKTAAENNVKTIEGVKSVTNNISVVAPQPDPVPINADDVITKGVNDAIKDFKNVKADIQDGVITLTGEIKRDELPRLMQMLNELRPRNIVNNLTIK